MSSEEKIFKLTQELAEVYKSKVSGLIQLCESPIEKLFLLNVINYFESSFGDYVISTNIEYTAGDIELKSGEAYLSKKGMQRNRFNCPVFPYSYRVEHVYFQLEVIPQFEIFLNSKQYRFDFMFEIKRKLSGSVVKICVECDGKEYHGNNIRQIDYDNDRDADCVENEILVLRYSGSKIYRSSDLNSFQKIIEKIIRIASK